VASTAPVSVNAAIAEETTSTTVDDAEGGASPEMMVLLHDEQPRVGDGPDSPRPGVATQRHLGADAEGDDLPVESGSPPVAGAEPASPGYRAPSTPTKPAPEQARPAEPRPWSGADRTADPTPATPGPRPGDDQWTIQPGDHLWGVARATLADHRSTPVSNQDVATYLEQLVDANRANLADPRNPDLVYPGQVMTLPPPPATSPPGGAS
jgi:nucleoid-associated protein YgaU